MAVLDNVVARNQAAPLDRSNCIMPSSTASQHSTTKSRIGTDVNLTWRQMANCAGQFGVFPHTILKACWILTLQCYIVADVICFKYTGPFEEPAHKASPDDQKTTIAVQYYTRINPNESLSSFLRRIDRSQGLVDGPVDPAGHDIGVAAPTSSLHHCNTGISIRDGGDTCNVDNENSTIELVIEPSVVRRLIRLMYDPSHTSAPMAASIARTFEQICSQLQPNSRGSLLCDIDSCPTQHLEKIKSWTHIDPVPTNGCLHELILEQCRKRPAETAIDSWDGKLTYSELDDLSSRLAEHLMDLGVGPEVFVFSCFERSAWAIVARLAILRAGGAYVSIFASNPPAYLESVVSRTKTRILLTDERFVARFQGVVETLIPISSEFLHTLPSSKRRCTTVCPDNACLVLFTSGSTGTPKGIIQTHQGYSSAIGNYARDVGLSSETRFLQFDDYAFDISNLEFLVPLILGGCCCVPRPTSTIQELASEINSLRANTIFLTPTVAIKLDPEDVPYLKNLCVGGEPLPKELVRKWDKSDTMLINQYGMGEVAICCALNLHVDPLAGAVAGRPSTGTIWLVNPSSPNKLMPIGAIGEIIIEGPHLARGYLDETATKRTEAGFLPSIPSWFHELHPDRGDTRLYRSGDLGRINDDGTVTYLGRKDTILKLDGCRIDALEVEHQGKKCLSDKDTLLIDLLGVIDRQDGQCLAALIYLDEHPNNTKPTSNGLPSLQDATTDPIANSKVVEIQESIAAALPHYMMPTMFVLMSWLPRTASKKIDRKKINMLGQLFYTSQMKTRRKDMSYADRV
ncbi:hypothetical protein F5Y18DRAFT_438707 [Xylariaceae sp. FL1019]|nr:hypothetical protein F5Y18DRAFT_438707 [Xylariaceae sp. FL1019]